MIKKIVSDAFIISKITILSLREALIPFIIVSIFIPLGTSYLVSLASPNWNLTTKIDYLSGMLVLSSSLTIINGVGQYIAEDRSLGLISWYRTLPVHPISYVIGITSTYLIGILIDSALLIPIASILWNIHIDIIYIGITIIVVIIQSLSLIGLGAIIGTRSNNFQTAIAITNLLSYVIAFATPAYYSINAIPEEFRFLCYILPTTEAALIIKRVYMYGKINFSLFMVLIFMSIPYMLIGFKGIKWREK